MNLGIVGSRTGVDKGLFELKLNEFVIQFGSPIKVISGGASGVDQMAENWAREKGIDFKVFSADWQTYGRSAGPIRNQQIVDACTHILAFPSKFGSGTQDTIRKAQKAISDPSHPMQFIFIYE